jgi:hypothetical protein
MYSYVLSDVSKIHLTYRLPEWMLPSYREKTQDLRNPRPGLRGRHDEPCYHYAYHDTRVDKNDLSIFWNCVDTGTDGKFSRFQAPAESEIRIGIPRALGVPRTFSGSLQVVGQGSSDLGKLSCAVCYERLDGYDHQFRSFDRKKLEKFAATLVEWQDGVGREDHGVGFATSESLGYGPPTMQNGDSVWLIGDHPQPFILRPIKNGYRFIGPCHVHEARVSVLADHMVTGIPMKVKHGDYERGLGQMSDIQIW